MDCLCDKGFEPMVQDFNEDNLVLPIKGKFNIQLQNIGDVSIFIQNLGEIEPGDKRCIGIEQLPCAIDLPITYAEQQSGTKKVRVWSSKMVCFDWKCINKAD